LTRAAIAVAALASLLGAFLLVSSTGSAQTAKPATAASGFDHSKHARALATAKAGVLTCVTCHDVNRPTAVRGHRTCFGKCHGKRPRKPRKGRAYVKLDAKRLRVCTTCHAPTALSALTKSGIKPPPVTLPLPKRTADLAVTTGVYPVGKGFSHARHDSRSKASCASCHRGVMLSLNNKPRRPRKLDCAGCHNGKKAFSMTAAKCRQCHFSGGNRIHRHATKLVRFSHKAHKRRGNLGSCATCHTLTGNGTPLGAARNHAPCSNSGCHRAEFKSLQPKICGACHIARQPWRRLHRDVGAPAETEFGAHFSHKAHLTGAKPRMKANCARCHQLASGKRELRPPRDHASCTGAGCHARVATVKGSAKPALNNCKACHSLELMRKHQLKRHTARWSVRSKFRHAAHKTRPLAGKRGQPLACQQCHSSILNSVVLRDVGTPQKKTCMGCHNGATAFKLTGHKCARCHGSDQ